MGCVCAHMRTYDEEEGNKKVRADVKIHQDMNRACLKNDLKGFRFTSPTSFVPLGIQISTSRCPKYQAREANEGKKALKCRLYFFLFLNCKYTVEARSAQSN